MKCLCVCVRVCAECAWERERERERDLKSKLGTQDKQYVACLFFSLSSPLFSSSEPYCLHRNSVCVCVCVCVAMEANGKGLNWMGMQHKAFNGYDTFGYQRCMQRMRRGCFMFACGLIGWRSVFIRYLYTVGSYHWVLWGCGHEAACWRPSGAVI